MINGSRLRFQLGVVAWGLLAPSAFLASAAGTSALQDSIISSIAAASSDPAFQANLEAWKLLSNAAVPVGLEVTKQSSWDERCISSALTNLTANVTDAISRARLLAAQSAHSGDWLMAPPITAVGLRLSDEAVRIAIGVRLGTNLLLCVNHISVRAVQWSMQEASMACRAAEVQAVHNVTAF